MTDRTQTFARILRLERGRTALLVVDMQRGFVDAGQAMEVPPAREIVPVIRSLLDGFRGKQLPIAFT
jgi:nicotinamidase-related amidase